MQESVRKERGCVVPYFVFFNLENLNTLCLAFKSYPRRSFLNQKNPSTVISNQFLWCVFIFTTATVGYLSLAPSPPLAL